MVALRVAGIILGIVGCCVGGLFGWLELRSPAMRPAPTETVERTSARVARGKYLVEHVADCINCHSDHLWERFGAPVKPGTLLQGGFRFGPDLGLPGYVSAQNLTPDPETGKAHWTDGEIMRAIREGVSRDGHALFPMMPQFRMMGDEDVRSVVAYLRTIPPVHNVIPPSQIAFPVNLLIKFAPKPIEGPVTAPPESNHLGHGRYLVEIAGCRDCHTPHDDHGKLIEGRDFSGGWEMRGPWGRVVTANITPDPETSFLGKATKEQFVARFKAFADLKEVPLAPKGRNTMMPWLAFSGMTEGDLGAIYDYLKTIRPIHHEVVSFPDAQ